MRDFIAAIENGSEPETVGTDNIKSLAMVLGAIESAETGRRVPISI
jgi:predicted dehydrogenase